jgi:UDP-N-acetylmuramyl pentapeptide synthase
MLNKVFLDKQGVIRIIVAGDQTAGTVKEMGEKIAFYIGQLRSEHRPVLVLDDLRHLGKTTSEARREVGRLAKQLPYDRAAMVGDGSTLMRYGTNLMLRAVGRGNARYFGHEETALKWLRTGAPALGARS